MNVAEINQLIIDNILSGGNRTTAARARTVFNAINSSVLNITDHLNVNGGYLGIDSFGKVDVSKIKKDTPTGQVLKDNGTWGDPIALNGNGLVRASGTTISYDNSAYITLASAITGYVLPGSGSSITASDNVLTAFGKAQFQINQLNSAKYQGSVSANYYPFSNGSNVLTNGRIYHQFDALFLKSADTNSYLRLENNNIYFNSNNGGILELQDNIAQLLGPEGGLIIDATQMRFSHNMKVNFDSAHIQFSGLTASTVPYLDSNKELRSSLTGPTALNFISTLSSNAQDQFDALYSLLIGSMNLRGAYTPSGGNYPTTGGSGSGGSVKKGNYWIASGIGGNGQTTIGSQIINNRDSIVALVDSPGQTDANWSIIEGNIGYVPLNQSLGQGLIYIGSSTNIGTARQITGDFTINDLGVGSINNGKITDAMIVSTFIKADGSVPLLANWSAGPYRIGSGGLDILSEDVGISISSNGIGIILESDTIALDIQAGQFRFNDPNKADGNMLVIDASGYVTSQPFFSSYVKLDGSTPLSGSWDAGAYEITAGPVTIGDELVALSINNAIVGAEINSLGDGIRINSNGRGIILNSDSTALDIETGAFKFNDSGRRLGSVATSDNDGIITLQLPAMYPIPKFTYANITSGSSFVSIASSKILANSMDDGDCAELVFIGDVQGGSSANIGFGFNINGVDIITQTMTPDGGGPKTVCCRVFLRRSGNNIYVAGDFNYGTWGSLNVMYAEDTAHTYNFTTDINISFIGNPGGGGRTVSGLSAAGYIIKVK